VRQAPPVGVTCSGRGGWRASGALLAALAGASVCAWGALQLGLGAAAASASAVAAGAAAAATGWRRASWPDVELRWNGQHWQSGDADGEVDVMLDLDAWMLLRLRPAAGRARWLPVSRAGAGAAWHPLRAALFAHAGAPAPDGKGV
jgi:hypothetical protein